MKRSYLILILVFLIPIVIVLVYLSGYSDKKDMVITDFSRQQIFEMTTSDKPSFFNRPYVVGVQITIKGAIQGNIAVDGGNCGGTLTGQIDTLFKNDWYSPKATLRITSLDDVKGKVVVSFKFLKI